MRKLKVQLRDIWFEGLFDDWRALEGFVNQIFD